MDVNSDIVTRSFDDDDFSDTLDIFIKEIQNKNYRVVKIVNVDNVKNRTNLVKDLKVGFDRYKIIEICNLFSCNEIISADLRAGVFMPQRFAMYQRLNDKKVYISYLKPTSFARLFGSGTMLEVAGRIERDIVAILDEL